MQISTWKHQFTHKKDTCVKPEKTKESKKIPKNRYNNPKIYKNYKNKWKKRS